MNILIAEDDNLTLKALKFTVEQLGHKVYTASNGEEAIKLVQSINFDLIFSDIVMPGISGLSMLSIFRNMYLIRIPIIIISTLDNEYTRETSLNLGASDFISKPFTNGDIACKIQLHSQGKLN